MTPAKLGDASSKDQHSCISLNEPVRTAPMWLEGCWKHFAACSKLSYSSATGLVRTERTISMFAIFSKSRSLLRNQNLRLRLCWRKYEIQTAIWSLRDGRGCNLGGREDIPSTLLFKGVRRNASRQWWQFPRKRRNANDDQYATKKTQLPLWSRPFQQDITGRRGLHDEEVETECELQELYSDDVLCNRCNLQIAIFEYDKLWKEI